MRAANQRVVMPKEFASPVPRLVRTGRALRAAKSHGTHRCTATDGPVYRGMSWAGGAYFDVSGAGGAGVAPLLCSSTTRRAR
jgi:hypothetical protein